MSIKKFLIRHNIIKGDFHAQGFVYITANRKPTLLHTNTIKWLEEVKVHCYYKDRDKMLFKALYERHPEYKGYIYLY